jgi:hypothetical protein
MRFCTLIQLEFESEDSYSSFVQQSMPRLYHSGFWRRLKAFVCGRRFDLGIDFVIVLNAIVLGMESEHELLGDALSGDEEDKFSASKGSILELGFTTFFFVEMVLKVVTMGKKRYWESTYNIFDCIVTLSSVAASIYVYIPNDVSCVWVWNC